MAWRSWDTWNSQSHQLVAWTMRLNCCIRLYSMTDNCLHWRSYRRGWHHQPSLPPEFVVVPVIDSWKASFTTRSLWRRTCPVEPSLRSRTSWDMRTSLHGQTAQLHPRPGECLSSWLCAINLHLGSSDLLASTHRSRNHEIKQHVPFHFLLGRHVFLLN